MSLSVSCMTDKRSEGGILGQGWVEKRFFAIIRLINTFYNHTVFFMLSIENPSNCLEPAAMNGCRLCDYSKPHFRNSHNVFPSVSREKIFDGTKEARTDTENTFH